MTQTVTCHKCGYTWLYKGKSTVAHCPNCDYKVFLLNRNEQNNTELTSLTVGLTKHTVTLNTDEDRIRIVPWGDIHIGAPEQQCQWSKAKAELDYVLNRENTYLLGMGDYMDCAQKMPWRRGPNIYRESLPPMQQYKRILEALKPLAEKRKILGLHWGNHEEWIMEQTGFQPVQMLCDSLNVPMLGPACETIVHVNKQSYLFYSQHGVSNAKLKHTKLGALIAAVKDVYADVYLYGHVHQLAATRGAKRFRQQTLKVYYVLTGHFLDWEGSYAQQFGLDPSPSGCAQIKLFADRHDVHVSI